MLAGVNCAQFGAPEILFEGRRTSISIVQNTKDNLAICARTLGSVKLLIDISHVDVRSS